MANLQELFEIPKWSSQRQEEIEQLYLAKGIDLEPVFYAAHEKTLKNSTPVTHRGRGFMSNTMNGNIIGTMMERYPEHMRVDVHGRHYFQLNEQTRIYLKKLDDRYCPRNIPTNHVKQLNTMELLLGDTPITVLYAGFRLIADKVWDEIAGCYLVEMRDLRRTNWVSDLTDLGARMAGTTAPVSPIAPIILPDQVIVKAKNKDTGDLGKTASETGQ
jgi:hypothetical protein